VDIHQKFIISLKNGLRKHLPLVQSLPGDDLWDALKCLRYPTPAASPDDFYFDSLVKGLIPKELFSFLHGYIKKSDAESLILLSLKDAKDAFHSKVWKPRCAAFAQFEISKGITSTAKLAGRPSAYNNHNRSRSSPAICPNIKNIWQSWIAQALGAKKSWTDFLTYINSL